jgi:hypothetical protein
MSENKIERAWGATNDSDRGDSFGAEATARSGKGASGPGGSPYCPQSAVPVRTVPPGAPAGAAGDLPPAVKHSPIGAPAGGNQPNQGFRPKNWPGNK